MHRGSIKATIVRLVGINRQHFSILDPLGQILSAQITSLTFSVHCAVSGFSVEYPARPLLALHRCVNSQRLLISDETLHSTGILRPAQGTPLAGCLTDCIFVDKPRCIRILRLEAMTNRMGMCGGRKFYRGELSISTASERRNA